MIALEKRFGPSEYEDSFGRLCKLTQTGSLADYQHQFEHLANRIQEIPEHALVSCFTSGLRPELRKETLVYRPQSLVQATGLARLFDDKSLDNKFNSKPGFDLGKSNKPPWNSRSNVLPTLLPNPSSKLLPYNSKPNSPAFIKKLTPSEMVARREKGLCYNCDENLFIGHKCKWRLHFFMMDY